MDCHCLENEFFIVEVKVFLFDLCDELEPVNAFFLLIVKIDLMYFVGNDEAHVDNYHDQNETNANPSWTIQG